MFVKNKTKPDFSVYHVFISGCTNTCFKVQDNYLAWEYPGCGKYFVFMAVQGILFLLCNAYTDIVNSQKVIIILD
jgi:hypothetical protein